MPPDKPETIIIDADFILDPKIQKASELIQTEGKKLLVFTDVEVIVDGVRRAAVKASFPDTEKEAATDVLKRAGLDVLKDATETMNVGGGVDRSIDDLMPFVE